MDEDPYVAHDRALRAIHAGLLARIDTVVATARPEAIAAACEPLRWHHHAEDAFLLAAIRRASPRRSSDVAFLERCARDHDELHALCERLRGAAPADVRALAGELRSRFAQHAADEEAALAPEHLRELIARDALIEVARDAEAHRPRAGSPR
jgi:hypothetical protein